MAKKGKIEFNRARKFMGVRKTPGPSGTSIWMVNYQPSIKEIIRGKSRHYLGEVYWFSKWRRYAYFPSYEIALEQSCLRQIADFCERATALFKQGKTRTNPAKKLSMSKQEPTKS